MFFTVASPGPAVRSLNACGNILTVISNPFGVRPERNPMRCKVCANCFGVLRKAVSFTILYLIRWAFAEVIVFSENEFEKHFSYQNEKSITSMWVKMRSLERY